MRYRKHPNQTTGWSCQKNHWWKRELLTTGYPYLIAKIGNNLLSIGNRSLFRSRKASSLPSRLGRTYRPSSRVTCRRNHLTQATNILYMYMKISVGMPIVLIWGGFPLTAYLLDSVFLISILSFTWSADRIQTWIWNELLDWEWLIASIRDPPKEVASWLCPYLLAGNAFLSFR